MYNIFIAKTVYGFFSLKICPQQILESWKKLPSCNKLRADVTLGPGCLDTANARNAFSEAQKDKHCKQLLETSK